jgi:hypothetical protein
MLTKAFASCCAQQLYENPKAFGCKDRTETYVFGSPYTLSANVQAVRARSAPPQTSSRFVRAQPLTGAHNCSLRFHQAIQQGRIRTRVQHVLELPDRLDPVIEHIDRVL